MLHQSPQTLDLKVEQGVALITINRPQVLNAADSAMLNELSALLERLQTNEKIHVLVLTGQGKAFMAGADIAQLQSLSLWEGKNLCEYGQVLFLQLEEFEKPIIAAVNGYAMGAGCELALACDIRIASTKARFALPEVGLGIIPGYGGTQRLARLVGKGRAMHCILTGATFTADQAHEWGMVEEVVSEEELLNKAMELARTIVSKAPLAVRMAKQAIHQGLQVDLCTGMALEANAFSLCFSSDDRIEGLTAFLEKRTPDFKGR